MATAAPPANASLIRLRGIAWDHPRGFAPMAATAEEYGRHHPAVQITWDKRSLQAFADAPLEKLAAEYDLLVVDHPHAGMIAACGCALPFDRAGRDAELRGLAAQSLGQSYPSYFYNGRQWALPIDAAAQVAAYRPDLLEHPPTTWWEVIELARAGKVLWPLKPVDCLMSFFTLAANRGTPCATIDAHLIAQADGLAVLEALAALARHVPRECLGINPPGTLDWLSTRDDKAYCPLLYGYSNYSRRTPGSPGPSEASETRLVLFADIPALGADGPCGSTLGGTGIAISTRCKSVPTAMDYAFWIASAACQRGLYFTSGGQPANIAAWSDPAVDVAANGFFSGTRQTLERAWVRPRYDGYLDFQDRGGTIINEFLATGGRDAKATLQQLEAAYRESRKAKKCEV